MPNFQINKKCYVSSRLRHKEIDPNQYVQDPNWLNDFFRLCAPKTRWDFEKHIGAQSNYNAKALLLHSLKFHYAILSGALNDVDPAFNLSADQKAAIVSKINEDIDNCTPGFHSRVNSILESYFRPQTIDELIGSIRHDIVERAANQATNEVHANNRFFIVAASMGYAVHPKLENDPYRGAISKEDIKQALEKAFSVEFQPFATLLKLKEMILSAFDNYIGNKKEGYPEATYGNGLDYLMKLFNESDRHYDYLIQDEETNAVCDINWDLILGKLWGVLIQERYFENSTLLGHGVAHWHSFVRKLTGPFEKEKNKEAIALIKRLFEDPNTSDLSGLEKIPELFVSENECFAYLHCNPNLPSAVKATLLLSYLDLCYKNNPAYDDSTLWQLASENPLLANEFGARYTRKFPQRLQDLEQKLLNNPNLFEHWILNAPSHTLNGAILKVRQISRNGLGALLSAQNDNGVNGLMAVISASNSHINKATALIELLKTLDEDRLCLVLQQEDYQGRNALTYSLMCKKSASSTREIIMLIESLSIDIDTKISILKLDDYRKINSMTLAIDNCPSVVPLLLRNMLLLDPINQQALTSNCLYNRNVYKKNLSCLRILFELNRKTFDLTQQANDDISMAQAAIAASQLQNTLVMSLADYTTMSGAPDSFTTLQKTWQTAIDTARVMLSQYSDWETLLSNLALILISIPLLGLPLVINYYRTSQKYVFFQTEPVNQLDRLETVIQDEPYFLAHSSNFT